MTPAAQGEQRRQRSSLAPARFVRIPLAAELTGYTAEAIMTKVKRGVWLEGKEYIRAPDGSILIDMEGYERWAVGQRQEA
jgi:hypothetical protein